MAAKRVGAASLNRRLTMRPGPGRARLSRLVGLLAGAVLAHSAIAQQAGNPERGAAKATPCAACHGPDGNSTLPGTPSLAGQPEAFLTLQLILFREGLRKVEAMNAALAGLAEQDLVDLAAHYARQKPRRAERPHEEALFARGGELAKAMACGGCHLPDYSGREQMPRLAGQREDYLYETMIAYRDSRRAGTDTTMTGVLYRVPDADIRALAHYLSSLP